MGREGGGERRKKKKMKKKWNYKFVIETPIL